ncbi:MAG: hypothetical protein IE880_08035, partial [Epsilonproteobacteria bacterium]|nr:hypothetical protein [Campylobacterota bacterium]
MEKFNSYNEYLNYTADAPDNQFWDKAFIADTKQSYEIYVVAYPNGLHTQEAKAKIDAFTAIEKDNEAYN